MTVIQIIKVVQEWLTFRMHLSSAVHGILGWNLELFPVSSSWLKVHFGTALR